MSLSFQKLTRAVNQTLDEEIYSTPELCLNLLQLSSTKTLCQTDSFITLILIDQCQVSISHESNTLVKLEYFTPITFDASKEIKIYNNSSNYNSHGNSIIMHSSSDGKDHGNSAKFDQGTVDKNNQTTRILWFVQKKGTKVSFQIENLVHSNGKNDLGGSTRDCLPAITSNDASTAKNAPKNDFSNNHETGDDLFSNVKTNDHGTTPINTILLGSMTILYVLKGSVKVVLGESTDSRVKEDLEVDQACVFNKDDENTPTDLSITPLATQDATVLIIQIHLSKPSSASLTVPPKPPTRSGSIIVFDDQPMIWNLSPPTLLMRRDSGDVSPTPNLSLKFYESAQHYHPPIFSDRHRLATQVPSPKIVDTLVIEDFPRGQVSTVWVNMVKQGLSDWIKVPVIIARGVEDGPVIGITAVVHGNELNGVPCIHRVISDIDVKSLKGALVAVPCVNVPGYLRFSREFSDGKDLNRYFPGTETGFSASIFNYNLFTKIIKKFNFLIDLHTASFGRVNSYYVRVDMNDPVSSIFAKLQQPQIILHNSGQDGTLRSAAAAIGIKSITVEIGNPQQFQNQFVQWSYKGVMRILAYLKMFSMEITDLGPGCPLTIVCSRGFWIYTRTGGVLEVYPGVNTVIRKGDLIARIKDIFGNIVDEVYSPQGGVTIGRSSNPVAMAGDRILHLGVIKKESEVLASEAKENY